jgi:two-component system, chemotaxis family, sensor kinase CheA
LARFQPNVPVVPFASLTVAGGLSSGFFSVLRFLVSACGDFATCRGAGTREKEVSDLQDEVVSEFLVESYENLEQLDRDLIALEQDPGSRPTLASIFRTIHTIKGTCGFFGFGKLESVTHVGENLLSKLRDGELVLRPDMTTALLSLVDAVREMLGNIESMGAEGEADYTDLVQTLIQLRDDGNESPAVSDLPKANLAVDAAAVVARSEIPVQPPESNAARAMPVHSSAASDSTIRVDVGLLDKLMNRVGELVLTRNQILRFTSTLSDSALLSTWQRLNLVTTELQEGVAKTRMQPIDNIWNNFSRLVRDLSLQCGKQVRIETEGKETELDKTIIEAIKNPLTHLVRNAIDHGIESPDVRVAAGKPAEGRLLLRAFHEGGQVNIEIIDNGGGLNLERIRQKAVERRLITPEQALRMSERDVAQLIFTPGFSTATVVTNVSGRGVGLDVVKTDIEKIGGTVDVQSRPGLGTTVKLKIPLTLAIIPALIVTCNGDCYAIPQVSLLELVRLEGSDGQLGIEWLFGAPVYRLRGKLLPIVDLRREFGLSEAAPQNVVNIVVLQADDRQFGLVVDFINDTEEIVVKPLSKQLKGIPIYAGATIRGDGKIALILDIHGIAQCASVVPEVRDRVLTEQISPAEKQSLSQMLLLIELASHRLAIPVSMVSRLEEIPRTAVEQAKRGEVVQYRGQIMPLLRLGDMLGVQTNERIELPLQVVVYSQGVRSIGLVVDRIADIVNATVESTNPAQSGDLLGSAVIQERITDLLNLPSLVRRFDPILFAGEFTPGASA